MKISIFSALLAIGWCFAAEAQQTASKATNSSPQSNSQNIAPQAEEVLRSACDYLGQAPWFTLSAELWHEHQGDSGEKLQYVRQAELEVKRPNRLHAEIHSPHSQRAFWFNGADLTVLDRKRNLFSSSRTSDNLDKALDSAREQFGIDLPLVDLAVSDPYKNATANVRKGIYMGLSAAMGYKCHHLAFVQDNVDWQVWIQEGPQPLIRKFVITHKNEPGSPEFTALITQWDMNSRIADATFHFEAPPGASKIEMRKEVAAAAAPAAQNSTLPEERK